MSTLTTVRNFADGDDFTEAQINDFLDSIEVWANGNVGTANISSNGVDTAQLAASSVTASKIASDAVTTAKLIDASVTGAKLATSAADASTLEVASGSMRIKDGGITKVKLSTSFGQQISSSSGNFTSSSTSFVDVTNLSVTLTTTGRPVFLMVQSDGGVSPSSLGANSSGGASSFIQCYFKFFRDSTALGQYEFVGADNTNASPRSGQNLCFVDTPAAGTYTYKLQVMKGVSSSHDASVQYMKLIAYEM